MDNAILKAKFMIVIIVHVLDYTTGQECVLSLHRDLPKKHEPLYFIQNGNTLDMLMPHMMGDDGVMTLENGQQLVLACPGKNNKLVVSGTEATVSKCVGGVMLTIDNQEFPTYQLECKSPVQAILQVTDEHCGPSATELRIGFETPNETAFENNPNMIKVPLETSFWTAPFKAIWNFLTLKKQREKIESSHWINLVTSCHDLNTFETHYSQHIIYGVTLAGAEIKNRRPLFQHGNHRLFQGIDPNQFYKKCKQRETFEKILGRERANEILQENALSRGHLAPDADFLFGTWQYMTYFYSNSAPQWLSINSGSWQHLERTIRMFAIATKSNFLVITGTFDILQLPDESMNYKPIYLDPDAKRYPVPKFFWKVVSYPESRTCIGFVSVNNPFLGKVPKYICTNICSISGWNGYKNFTKGFIYCCDVEELRNIIDFIPPIDCNRLLIGPKAFYNYDTTGKPNDLKSGN